MGIIAELMAEWQPTRMCSVLAGHAGNQNSRPSSPSYQAGVHAEFWNVPAIREVVKILFNAEHQTDSSYQLLLRLCGPSLKLPEPFDKHRDEPATTRRMAEVKTQVKNLLSQVWEVYAAD